MADYHLYTIQIAKGYGMNEWRENLKECLLMAGVQDKPVVFLFDDTQIIMESQTEDINAILNSVSYHRSCSINQWLHEPFHCCAIR